MKDVFPVVSIMMPAYNAEQTIKAAIQSISMQTYPKINFYLMDNCSEDHTVDEARKSYERKPITVIETTKNIGASANFTRCIAYSGGDYTAIYHADDVYDPLIVESQVNFLDKNKEVGVVFTGAKLINLEGKLLGKVKLEFLKREESIVDFKFLIKLLLKNSNFLVCPSAMVRTHIYKNEIKEWRNNLFGSSADLDVWLRIAESYKIGILKSPKMSLRISTQQWSHSADRLRVEPAPLLTVLDYYLDKYKNKNVFSKKDFDFRQTLELADIAKRLINYCNSGNDAAVYQLDKSFWVIFRWKYLFLHRRVIKAFVVVLMLKFRLLRNFCLVITKKYAIQ